MPVLKTDIIGALMSMWKEFEQAFVDDLQDIIIKHCNGGHLSPCQIIGCLHLQVDLLSYEIESARNAKEKTGTSPNSSTTPAGN